MARLAEDDESADVDRLDVKRQWTRMRFFGLEVVERHPPGSALAEWRDGVAEIGNRPLPPEEKVRAARSLARRLGILANVEAWLKGGRG